MPTIRDLVDTLRQRDDVEAAVVLGRDGLLIDSRSVPQVDAERVAALVPSIVSAADELGRSTRGGPMTAAVLEYPSGLALACALSDEAILLVLARQSAHVGKLLFDLRRNREAMAAMV
jgi:uncharacterized protein